MTHQAETKVLMLILSSEQNDRRFAHVFLKRIFLNEEVEFD